MTDNNDKPINPESVLNKAIASLNRGDVGAHWEPVAIEAAKHIRKHDKALFQRFRQKIKNAHKGSQISEWTNEVQGKDGNHEDSTKADGLIKMVLESSDLFFDGKNTCYASFENSGHKETWALCSEGFADWLSFKAYTDKGFSPSKAIVKQAINALSGMAKYGDKHDTVKHKMISVKSRYPRNRQ